MSANGSAGPRLPWYRRGMRRVAALLVLAMTIAGCGSATTGGSADGSPPSSADGGTATAPASERSSDSTRTSGDAPFGTVDAVGGGQIDGTELAGHDLALWFWAPW